jgi:hypothetical protein
MNTFQVNPLAQDVKFSDADFIVHLKDARTLSVPLAWFPRLAQASKSELLNYQILGDGEGIHWPDLDEDISVKGLLFGQSELAA